MSAALLILILAFLNRCRGDDRWMPRWLRGRPLYYVSPVVGLGAMAWHGWESGLLFAIGYFIWGLAAWGYLQLLGRPVDGKKPEPLETVLLKLALGSVHGAFFLRHLFVLPLALGATWLTGSWMHLTAAPVFALAVVAAYEMAWRVQPRAPIIVGECATGALWGLAIIAY